MLSDEDLMALRPYIAGQVADFLTQFLNVQGGQPQGAAPTITDLIVGSELLADSGLTLANQADLRAMAAAPSAPASGYNRIYTLADGLHVLTPAGADQLLVSAAWQSYSCSWTSDGTQPSLGNGTLTARQRVIGKSCLTVILLTWGTTTNGGTGNWRFSLPQASANLGVNYSGMAAARDAGTASYIRQVPVGPNVDLIQFFNRCDDATNNSTLTATYPFTWGANDSLTIDVEYELP